MGSEIERRFLIVAGEASGDLHAARMVRALSALGPCRVRGAVGPELAAAGAEIVVPTSELAVLGFSGVIARLPRIWRAYRSLLAEADRFRPHAAVLVDSPGFNFRIGPALKRRGIPIFYYIAPQVWAWHRERAQAMSAWVDRLAVVFPFEEPLFRAAGVNATFVGHPLLDALEPERSEALFRDELGIDPEERILGLLPGSRPQEIHTLLPPMIEAARLLCLERSGVTPVIALAPGLGHECLARLPAGVRVVRGRTRAVQAFSTACAVASGTATLETALFGTPLAVVYRVSRLNFAIARRVVRLRHIALPNIVAEEEVAPELIQDAFTPERLSATLAPWFDDPVARSAARERLGRVRARLGMPGAAHRTAAWLRELTD